MAAATAAFADLLANSQRERKTERTLIAKRSLHSLVAIVFTVPRLSRVGLPYSATRLADNVLSWLKCDDEATKTRRAKSRARELQDGVVVV